MKAKIYVGAKKYALYIGRKIVQKTLEFLTLPARFISKKVQDLKQYLIYGQSVQRNLPEGYTQLEYIESTDMQRINTGFIPTINSKIRVKFAPMTTSQSIGFFGSRIDPFRFCATTFNSGAQFTFAMTNDTWSTNRTDVVLNKIYDCTAYNGKQIINGVEYNEQVLTSFTTTSSFLLSPIDRGGLASNGPAKFYLCQIWENNVLVKDLIPAKRNSDNVLGMYDLVSNTFLTNVGTGTFVAGNVAPTPTTPIEIESVGDKQLLPYGYTQLEYLESTGTQYIDTGYKMTSDVVEYGIRFYGTQPNGKSLFGTEGGSPTLYSGIPYSIQNTVYIGRGTAGSPSLLTDAINDYIIATSSSTNGTITTNGVALNFTYSGGIYKDGNIYLFTNNSIYIKQQATSIKCYSFYIKDNGVLVRNLIPAKRNSDNALGMYDTVSNTFLTNAGTGEFIAGNDIEQGGYKIPIEINGTTTNIYLDEPLRKIGEYADYIDFENQKVVRNVEKRILDGNITRGVVNVYGQGRCLATPLGKPIPAKIGLVSNFSVVNYTSSSIISTGQCFFAGYDGTVDGIYLCDNSLLKLSDWKTWLSNNNVELIYPITPIEQPITLPAISLPQDTVTIDTETNVKPSKLIITGDIDNE